MFDFGKNGRRPNHPALLDWLAAEFMDRGWSMKAMHRLIMTSEAYRRSSRGNLTALRVDPAWVGVSRFQVTLADWDAPGLDMDRKNNGGHYEPGNLRMVTRSVNSRNRRVRPAELRAEARLHGADGAGSGAGSQL